MRNKPIQWFPVAAYLSSLMPVINKKQAGRVELPVDTISKAKA
jgi:hypothetical protein